MRTQFVMRALGVSGLVLLACSFGYGQDLSYDECELASRFIDEQGEVKKQFLQPFVSLYSTKNPDTYPPDAAKLAIKHLQAACCQKGRLAGVRYCSPAKLAKTFPDQRMLFRQIVDVGMRRMDGYAEGIYGHDELLDPLAKSWRDYITKQGSNVNGTPPQLLVNKFTEMVGPVKGDGLQIIAPVIEEDASIKRCQELKNRTMLGERINQQCAIAYCVTEELYERAEIAGYHKSKQGLQTMYHECVQMQQGRVLEEYQTAAAVVQAQAVIMMRRSLEAYMQEYLVNNRLRALVEKMLSWVSNLEIVNGKYTEGTKECN